MLKHSFRLVKVVDGCQGYTSVVELSTIPEKFINHSQFGRCRIQNCEEVESHCGHGQGCFSVEDVTLPIASIMERVQSYKKLAINSLHGACNMWQKPIAITIDGITHSSVRKCCEYYGIKPNTVFNKMRRKKISATDAILDSIRPTYEVDGMKFNRIVDMAEYYHIPRATLGYRLLRGWSIEDAVHLPANGRGVKRHGKQILKRYKIGNECGTARELSEKYGIPVDKIYRLYGGKNSEKM